MAERCRELEISRKTAYKIYQRYRDFGLEGLTDRSRRPYRQANQLPMRWKASSCRFAASTRPGAPKIRERLRRRHEGPHTPAISTVHAVPARHGLVARAQRRARPRARGTRSSRRQVFVKEPGSTIMSG